MNAAKKATASKIWREQTKKGLTTLNFKDFVSRENAKGWKNFDSLANDSTQQTLNASITALHEAGGLKTTAGKDYIFGINRKALTWVGVGIVVLTASILVYKKLKH